ncbi:MAG: hypothetical protein GY913_06970 [Proteobacteria bacterium]|nr:hypothetical protein [Pseudomonadota bacterium]MCP4916649.1 hypothetical protein [Pseudomonadota bacterium]
MFLLLLACNGKDDNNTDSDSGLEVNSPFSVDTAPSGNMDCVQEELTSSPEAKYVGNAEIALSIAIQGSNDPIPDLQIVVTGSGEEPLTVDADEDGNAGTPSLRVCTPLSAVVGHKAGGEGGQVVNTTSAKMLGPDDTQWRVAAVTKGQFENYANQLGVERQQGTGIISGTIKACGADGLDHVQLSVENGNGTVAWGYVGDDGWGSGEWTNEGGGFAAVNVQAGPNTLTAWIWNGEKHVPVARAEISVPADGVRSIQLQAGKNGELNVPGECTETNGGGGDTGGGGGGDTGE